VDPATKIGTEKESSRMVASEGITRLFLNSKGFFATLEECYAMDRK
jgi:hypothetical protein